MWLDYTAFTAVDVVPRHEERGNILRPQYGLTAGRIVAVKYLPVLLSGSLRALGSYRVGLKI